MDNTGVLKRWEVSTLPKNITAVLMSLHPGNNAEWRSAWRYASGVARPQGFWGLVAQGLEHTLDKRGVGGSNPPRPTIAQVLVEGP